MDYNETISYLFSRLPMYQRTGKAAYKANLDNTHALDSLLDHPHRRFTSIHVAGTNGKGSVSHMLASILTEAGYRTGLYTSPHLLDFRERIRIDGTMIGEQEVVDFTERIRSGIDAIDPSFFEVTVAMAFDHFAKEQVDIAVLETGMGGRLDSTNIVTPALSVITNISLDHTEFLGSTIELIAAEKGGIIKEHVPVVVGRNRDTVYEVLGKMAASREAVMIRAGDEREFNYMTLTGDQQHTIFHFTDEVSGTPFPVETDLGGMYQHENISTVLTALRVLRGQGVDLSAEAERKGFAGVRRNTSLRGRWEVLGANPRIICDTAHNAGGVQFVSEQLRTIQHKKLHMIWGMVGDKPAAEILRLLPPDAAYYFTQPSIPRAMPVEKLAGQARDAGLPGDVYGSVEEAFEAARAHATPEDTIFIGGSTFVVADLLGAEGTGLR